MAEQSVAHYARNVERYSPGEIEQRLRKGSTDEILDALAALMAAYPNVRDAGGSEAQRIRGYVIALEEFGLDTIRRAVRAALGGKIGQPGFLPLAPELAAWCRAEERFDRERLREVEHGPVRADLPPRSPRVLRGFDQLSEALAKTAIGTSLANARANRASHRKENHNGNRGGD